MRVKDKNGKGRRWYERSICGGSGPVEFDKNGVATVSAEIGKAMCQEYPGTFSELKSGRKKSTDGSD